MVIFYFSFFILDNELEFLYKKKKKISLKEKEKNLINYVITGSYSL